MKSINFIFRIHQRFNLKHYAFFDIGNDHYYYDDYANESAMQATVENNCLEANRTLLEMIRSANGKFKVSFSISGLALEQFEQFAPAVIDSFRELAKTGCVEFLATPYAHSLAALYNEQEFVEQVTLQADKIKALFGRKPTVFANLALLYSDEIGEMVAGMGYKAILVEGAKHVLGWKSPHYLYHHINNPKLKLLVRNDKLSDDINYRFSQWQWDQYPLTAEKFVKWVSAAPAEEKVFNICMGYEALGLINSRSSGIFDFFKALPMFALEEGITFALPSECVERHKPIDVLSSIHPVSWTDEEKDISAWCGNELQQEALGKLYSLADRVHLCSDMLLKFDWLRLQDASHFFVMATKHYSNGKIYAQPIAYESPYHAFINYMNVLSDFMERVEAQFPSSVENEELNALLKTIYNQEKEIAQLKKKASQLKETRSKGTQK
ncbi:MAG: glycoside hydrolase family 57 protein [Prevotellaceae bacterium]|jgi:alpha-amylase|nr:glycoside hydrolase family 57 protein [Prevotellaceae bacterium]